MNIVSMGGTAFMAYYTGVSSIQQSERAVLSAKQGVFSGGSFIATLQEQIRGVPESQGIADVDNMTQEEAYMQHLKEKYGVVRVESIGKDQKSLDKVGSSMMSGTDVVIAPNILTKMAENPKKAAEIEGKID